MSTLTINLPADIASELARLGIDPETFIIESLRQRLESRECERQYHDECRMNCFAGSEKSEEDEECDTWETF